MKIHKIDCGTFKCDAGALFGVIPKPLWSRVYSSDEYNRCQLNMRNLLIEEGNRKILIDVGSGMNYSEKYIRNNSLDAGSKLYESLNQVGVDPSDITDIIFTHLHWDHSCGAFDVGNGEFGELFPNANYFVSRAQWDNAHADNPRENAAYHIKDLDLMEKSGRLFLLDKDDQPFQDYITLFYMDGHTLGQIIPVLHHSNGESIVFTADFIPTLAHVSNVWVAAYDLFPLIAMKEKESFLRKVVDNKWVLFFQHDAYCETANVILNNSTFKGSPVDTFTLS
ncbi:MBL fold metallo-hydrolase [Halosquirtibacter xylanolyticus]|uniref:MBL fold metallo-hydrolase n=1 Tax=Halosquirtibacter xylanolyticus TaxID=3374599 RepID=UPI0037496B07|nr:MBL fold metallo-hydrolase [Prolixibacteraceae bacterium]